MKKNQEEKDIVDVGRRKTAIASVRVRRGKGNWKINGKKMEEYFPLETQKAMILAPLKVAETPEDYDILVNVKGGGLEAQAVATRLGLARALVKKNEDLQKNFKELGFLTRDSRKKERKKYGLAGARKRFQFSKR